jgi:hypothetical protein
VEEDGAASKLQAIQRGNTARKTVVQKKEEAVEEDGAASKLQAIQRGNTARKTVVQKKEEAADAV